MITTSLPQNISDFPLWQESGTANFRTCSLTVHLQISSQWSTTTQKILEHNCWDQFITPSNYQPPFLTFLLLIDSMYMSLSLMYIKKEIYVLFYCKFFFFLTFVSLFHNNNQLLFLYYSNSNRQQCICRVWRHGLKMHFCRMDRLKRKHVNFVTLLSN